MARRHASIKISGVPKIVSISIAGYNIDTSTEDIKSHCGKLRITLKLSKSLPTKATWYLAFIKTVLDSDREILLSANSGLSTVVSFK